MCSNQDCIDIRQKDSQLWQRYQREKAKTPMLFPTEGAKLLGISELTLLLASPFTQYIGTDCPAVLAQLEQFDELLSIVRNDNAVHEKIGQYKNLKISPKMALMVNVGGLDLRYFMSHWQHMLALTDTNNPDKPTYSIQFFDECGNAINKVFLQSTTPEQITLWQNMIETAAKQASTYVDLESPENNKNSQICLEKNAANTSDWQQKTLDPDAIVSLQQQWQAMTNIHQFHGILQNLGIDRASSYHYAPQNQAIALQPNAVEAMLNLVKQQDCPLMTFVGNTGVVQIQTGKVSHIKRMGDWINILDKDTTQFTLHLNDTAIRQLWVVKRPTSDGIVTCVEVFDQAGNTIVSFFGQRLEGETELASWRQVTDDLIANFALPKPKKTAENNLVEA